MIWIRKLQNLKKHTHSIDLNFIELRSLDIDVENWTMKFMNHFQPLEFWGISTGRQFLAFFFFFFFFPPSSALASLETSLTLPKLSRCSTPKDSANFSLTSFSLLRSTSFFPLLLPHAKVEPTKNRSKRKKMNCDFMVFVKS